MQTKHTEQGVHTNELHISSIKPEVLFKVGDLPVTNSLFTSFVSVFLIVVLTFLFRKKISLIPGKIQSVVEIVIESILDFMAEIFESKQKAYKFFPFIFSIFVFIAFVNLFKFVPGLDAIYVLNEAGEKVNLFRPVATDLNVTLALAIVVMVVVEVVGISTLGLFKYGKRFINLSSPLGFIVGLIELMSEFVRLIAFSFRLFGNIFAGKILLAVIVYFAPYLLPVPVYLFEMFIAVVQAAIFALLALLFIKLAMVEQGH